MVEAGGDEGNKRRLPSWMQAITSKAEGGDKNIGIQNDGDKLVSDNSKPKKQTKKAVLPREKGETNRRKRKITQQDEPDGVENASPKKMSVDLEEKQVREPSVRRKRKATSGRLRSGKDSKIPPPVDDDDDDDEELTPGDLLSIAEEYVKADKDVVLQEQSTRESEFRRPLSNKASIKTKSKSSLIDLEGNQRSPAHETTNDSTQSLKVEEPLINISRTGDPAQDMLNLLLGPLLKKTDEEKRTEFILKDLKFADELGKGRQNDVKEETVTLTKKKCTLKDKVAMLLD
ncbi:hypothetical protein CCACVL1_07837 [Corchorus capsularis]|uniref:Uncharacterized protein n=1 Tax=Corchorus capsularis TaxID=210143 RepID=A0A1R3J3S3_COCAP|nr:hypothetical protein CCACVL1_07837 [Corchorus capsularis]